MPDYLVTLSDGRTFKVTADAQPSEADVMAQLQSAEAPLTLERAGGTPSADMMRQETAAAPFRSRLAAAGMDINTYTPDGRNFSDKRTNLPAIGRYLTDPENAPVIGGTIGGLAAAPLTGGTSLLPTLGMIGGAAALGGGIGEGVKQQAQRGAHLPSGEELGDIAFEGGKQGLINAASAGTGAAVRGVGRWAGPKAERLMISAIRPTARILDKNPRLTPQVQARMALDRGINPTTEEGLAQVAGERAALARERVALDRASTATVNPMRAVRLLDRRIAQETAETAAADPLAAQKMAAVRRDFLTNRPVSQPITTQVPTQVPSPILGPNGQPITNTVMQNVTTQGPPQDIMRLQANALARRFQNRAAETNAFGAEAGMQPVGEAQGLIARGLRRQAAPLDSREAAINRQLSMLRPFSEQLQQIVRDVSRNPVGFPHGGWFGAMLGGMAGPGRVIGAGLGTMAGTRPAQAEAALMLDQLSPMLQQGGRAMIPGGIAAQAGLQEALSQPESELDDWWSPRPGSKQPLR